MPYEIDLDAGRLFVNDWLRVDSERSSNDWFWPIVPLRPALSQVSTQSESNIERSHSNFDRGQDQPFELLLVRCSSHTKAQWCAPACSSAIRSSGQAVSVTAALIVRRPSGAPCSEINMEPAGCGAFVKGECPVVRARALNNEQL